MDMPMSSTGTATASAAMASSTHTMSMGGMGGNTCKISMLWNWNTIDACFIAQSWQITSRGAFAGSCIGVVLLVISLEMLRRAAKEYDRYLVRQHRANHHQQYNKIESSLTSQSAQDVSPIRSVEAPTPFRPKLWQQIIRSILYVLQFGVGYFVMLLAMYYNGYFIICILIGAFLGSFIFNWEAIGE
ncbi:Copper Transporter integral membrane protein that functions in high affinity copper transport [Sporothrix stenoceras]